MKVIIAVALLVFIIGGFISAALSFYRLKTTTKRSEKLYDGRFC